MIDEMKRFTVLEEESGLRLVPSPWFRALAKHEEIVGKAVKSVLFYRQGDRFKWCLPIEELTETGKIILSKIVNDEKFAEEISSKVRKSSQELHDFCEKIDVMELNKKDNSELAMIFREYSLKFEENYAWGLLVEMMEVYNSLFSKFVAEKIKRLVREKSLGMNEDACLAILSIPEEESFAKKQEKAFLRLVEFIQKRDRKIDDEAVQRIIKEHLRKYSWVYYNYEGPAMTKGDMVNLLKHELAAGIDPVQKLTILEAKYQEDRKKQKKLMKELAPDKSTQRLILIAKEFLTIKMIRAEARTHCFYINDKIREIASRRFGITINQCRCLTFDEFVLALETGKIDKNELTAREKEMAQLAENGLEKIYTGKKAEELRKQIIEVEVKETNEIRGTCASPGKAKGLVKVITHVEDMAKMKQGDILVANATNPNFVPVMEKAAAIITDMGGITCHAAIVSREMGKPCVIGTKIATKALKDGDLVEVDAEKGTVKIIK